MIDRLSCPTDPPHDLARAFYDAAHGHGAADDGQQLITLVRERHERDPFSQPAWDLRRELFEASGTGTDLRFEEVSCVPANEPWTRRIGDTAFTASVVDWTGVASVSMPTSATRESTRFSLRTSMQLLQTADDPARSECWYRWPARVQPSH